MVGASFFFLFGVICYLSFRNFELKDENERLRGFDTYHNYPPSPIGEHRCKINGKCLQKSVTINAVDKQIEINADVELNDNFRLYFTNCGDDFRSKFELADRIEKVTWQLDPDCSITFISGFVQCITSDGFVIQCDRYVLNRGALKG